jgi:hypothetical protein
MKKTLNNMKTIILLALLITSCSTVQVAQKNRTQRYLDRKMENTQRQYAIVNNQIIIFENIQANDSVNINL